MAAETCPFSNPMVALPNVLQLFNLPQVSPVYCNYSIVDRSCSTNAGCAKLFISDQKGKVFFGTGYFNIWTIKLKHPFVFFITTGTWHCNSPCMPSSSPIHCSYNKPSSHQLIRLISCDWYLQEFTDFTLIFTVKTKHTFYLNPQWDVKVRKRNISTQHTGRAILVCKETTAVGNESATTCLPAGLWGG